jgi:hypothetical protein
MIKKIAILSLVSLLGCVSPEPLKVNTTIPIYREKEVETRQEKIQINNEEGNLIGTRLNIYDENNNLVQTVEEMFRPGSIPYRIYNRFNGRDIVYTSREEDYNRDGSYERKTVETFGLGNKITQIYQDANKNGVYDEQVTIIKDKNGNLISETWGYDYDEDGIWEPNETN